MRIVGYSVEQDVPVTISLLPQISYFCAIENARRIWLIWFLSSRLRDPYKVRIARVILQ